MNDREKVIRELKAARLFFEMGSNRADGVVGNLGCKSGMKYIEDALELLKEQEGVVPYIDIDEAKCPVCKVKLTRQELIGDDVLFEDFFDYCPHCGKPVLWEGR